MDKFLGILSRSRKVLDFILGAVGIGELLMYVVCGGVQFAIVQVVLPMSLIGVGLYNVFRLVLGRQNVPHSKVSWIHFLLLVMAKTVAIAGIYSVLINWLLSSTSQAKYGAIFVLGIICAVVLLGIVRRTIMACHSIRTSVKVE